MMRLRLARIGVEQVAEFGVGPELGGFDGWNGQPERFGDFESSQSSQTQFDDLPMRFGQLLEHLLDEMLLLDRQHLILG